MADIKVERGRRGSAWWLLAALVVLGLLAALLFTDWYDWRGERPEAALFDPDRPAVTLRFDGDAWVPAGEPVAYPMAEMLQVGESRAGHDLYVHRVQRIAGGGGGQAAAAQPGEISRVYVRTTSGLYQPLVRRE